MLYQDELKVFQEQEMDKISWFKNLSIPTKNELIFMMERETHMDGSFLLNRGDKAEKLYLVQGGTIDNVTTFDRKRLPLIIERLERGAILNSSSFLVNDELDSDYKCNGKVSVFALSLKKVKELMKKRSDLYNHVTKEEHRVLSMQNEIALDYIFPNDN